MIKISLKDFAKELNYKYQGQEEIYFSQIVLDSREVTEGSLFVAVKGQETDGHRFIDQALKKGAVGVVSFSGQDLLLSKTNYVFANEEESLEEFFKKTGKLIKRRSQAKIIGITGSVGKTTSKDMLYSILKRQAPTIKTEGNFNNELGLPITMSRSDESTSWMILEMGMRGRGEISYLVDIAQPDHAIITSIEPVHAELLGSLEDIAAAKAEIGEQLSSQACLVINYKDREILLPHLKDCKAQIITVGFAKEADYFIEELITADQLTSSFLLKSREKTKEIKINIPGRHNVQNAAMVSALADFLGIDDRDLEGLSETQYSQMRFNLKEKQGVKIINDAYNANPASTSFALETLDRIEAKRKLFVFADMFELGAYEVSGHEEVAHKISQIKPDYIFLLGDRVAHTYDKLRKINYNMEGVFIFKEKNDLHAKIKDILETGDLILLKGSRGMQLEETEKEIEAFLNGKQ